MKPLSKIVLSLLAGIFLFSCGSRKVEVNKASSSEEISLQEQINTDTEITTTEAKRIQTSDVKLTDFVTASPDRPIIITETITENDDGSITRTQTIDNVTGGSFENTRKEEETQTEETTEQTTQKTTQAEIENSSSSKVKKTDTKRPGFILYLPYILIGLSILVSFIPGIGPGLAKKAVKKMIDVAKSLV